MDGVFTGVLDFYYAKMITPDTSTTAPVYGTPKVLGMAIEATITPSYAEGRLDASNKRIKAKKRIASYTASLNPANIAPDVYKDILGRVQDENGVQTINGANAVAPTVALGLCATYDDGTREFWWLLSCTFAEITRAFKTESDAIEYQTPTIEAECIPLKNTADIASVADTNDTSIASSVFANWFNAVYLPGAAEEPTADDLPIEKVHAVAALPETGAIHDIYVMTATAGGHAAGTMWRFMGDAWEEYGAA